MYPRLKTVGLQMGRAMLDGTALGLLWRRLQFNLGYQFHAGE